MSQTFCSTPASPMRLRVTPRTTQEEHHNLMIDRRSIRIVLLPSAVQSGLIEAPWAVPARFSGDVVHVVAGNLLAVRRGWTSLKHAIAALSDLDLLRVNDGVAVNMNLVDVVELHSKASRVGFYVRYHAGSPRVTEFVRVSREPARAIRRRY